MSNDKFVSDIYKQYGNYTWNGYVSVENLHGGGYYSYWYSGYCPIILISEFLKYKKDNKILGWRLEKVK